MVLTQCIFLEMPFHSFISQTSFRYILNFCGCLYLFWYEKRRYLLVCYQQGRRQGKSLEGAKLPGGSMGQRPLAGVQGAEPLCGGQGAKPPEADDFLVLKS